MKILKNYINGQLVEPLSGKYLDNENPSRGEVYGKIPDSGSEDVSKAVEAARNAFPAWSTSQPAERSDILLKVASLIDEKLEQLAEAETLDNGKPIRNSRTIDIPRASANFRFFATAILHFSSESHVSGSEAINYTRRDPVGVAGCISPWNLPLYLFTWKIAPALAAGNTVVAKPSEITPLTAFLLSEICIEAGMPPGVLNIVHGTGPSAGQAIVEHPEVKLISFTGGTATGKMIAATAAPMFKKLSLELGGKNPNLIFEDCDFEEAVKISVRSSFANQGQICLCGSRILVQKSIYEKFKTALVERTRKLVIGDPTDPDTQIGALVSEAHLKKVMSYVELAKEEGGTLLTGGDRVEVAGLDGYFLQPTIIEGLDENCRVNQEEIFGPVVTLIPFEDEEEALRIANSTSYGLSATLWTNDLNRAHRLGNQIQSGIIWINCWLYRDLRTPFGGMKQSGVGREGGLEALRFFTEPKNICIKQ